MRASWGQGGCWRPYNSGILATGVRRAGAVTYNYSAAPQEIVAVQPQSNRFVTRMTHAACGRPAVSLESSPVLTVIAGMGTREQVEAGR